MERKVAARIARLEPEFRGRRACLDLAIAAVRPSRGVTAAQAGAFRAAACGALMTMDRARKLGYDVDGLCPLCRAARDTLFHRVYRCSATEAAVRAAVPAWFWAESQRAVGSKVFMTTALIPHPADVAPPPRSDLFMQVEVNADRERADPEALAAARADGLGEHGDDGRGVHQRAKLGGLVYFDGSCLPSPIRDMARAACSIVEVTRDGEIIRTLAAVVPWHLPQTGQCAERLAMSLGYRYVCRAAQFIGDCIGVVRAMGGKARRAIVQGAKYAGLVLDTHRAPERRQLVHTVRWTKAHRAETGQEEEGERRDIRGNALADELAKAAVKLHPPAGVDVEAAMNFAIKRAPLVAKAVIAALQLFPPAPRNMPRVPRPADEQQARRTRRHHWRHQAGTWRCTVCRDWVNTASIPRRRRHQTCRGHAIDQEAPKMAAAGHVLCRAEAELPFTLCTACGAWGNRRSKKLARPCGPPSTAGLQAIKRAEAGWHPMLRKDSSGNDLPRARAVLTHAFDAARGQWLPLQAATPAPHPPGPGRADADDPQRRLQRDGPMLAVGPIAADSHHDADACAALFPDLDDLPPVPEMDMSGYDAELEEDVFGHGGSLDQAAAVPEGRVEATRGATDTVMRMDPQDGSAANAACPCRLVPPSVMTSARRSAPRGQEASTADRTLEAIRRMTSGSRPPRGDASVRLGELRKRVMDRLAGEHARMSRPRINQIPAGPGLGDDQHAVMGVDLGRADDHCADEVVGACPHGPNGDAPAATASAGRPTGDSRRAAARRPREEEAGSAQHQPSYHDRAELIRALKTPRVADDGRPRHGEQRGALAAHRGRDALPRNKRAADDPGQGAAVPRGYLLPQRLWLDPPGDARRRDWPQGRKRPRPESPRDVLRPSPARADSRGLGDPQAIGHEAEEGSSHGHLPINFVMIQSGSRRAFDLDDSKGGDGIGGADALACVPRADSGGATLHSVPATLGFDYCEGTAPAGIARPSPRAHSLQGHCQPRPADRRGGTYHCSDGAARNAAKRRIRGRSDHPSSDGRGDTDLRQRDGVDRDPAGSTPTAASAGKRLANGCDAADLAANSGANDSGLEESPPPPVSMDDANGVTPGAVTTCGRDDKRRADLGDERPVFAATIAAAGAWADAAAIDELGAQCGGDHLPAIELTGTVHDAATDFGPVYSARADGSGGGLGPYQRPARRRIVGKQRLSHFHCADDAPPAVGRSQPSSAVEASVAYRTTAASVGPASMRALGIDFEVHHDAQLATLSTRVASPLRRDAPRAAAGSPVLGGRTASSGRPPPDRG